MNNSGLFLFAIEWSVDRNFYTATVDMKLVGHRVIYSVAVSRPATSRQEMHIELTLMDNQWTQVDKNPHRFTQFFLNHIGLAIERALG